jgi:hypothetical protein
MMWVKRGVDRGPQLSPEVLAAMTDLTKLVYDSHVSSFLRPRQLATHCHLDDPNGSGRAATVAMFKHLKYFQVPWEPDLVVRWAEHQGWLASDVALLNEFASGVKAGARFHTVPQPWPGPVVDSWVLGLPMTTAVSNRIRFRRKRCCRGDFKPPARRRDPRRAAFRQLSRK